MIYGVRWLEKGTRRHWKERASERKNSFSSICRGCAVLRREEFEFGSFFLKKESKRGLRERTWAGERGFSGEGEIFGIFEERKENDGGDESL